VDGKDPDYSIQMAPRAKDKNPLLDYGKRERVHVRLLSMACAKMTEDQKAKLIATVREKGVRVCPACKPPTIEIVGTTPAPLNENFKEIMDENKTQFRKSLFLITGLIYLVWPSRREIYRHLTWSWWSWIYFFVFAWIIMKLFGGVER
jgi:hypothetical protein